MRKLFFAVFAAAVLATPVAVRATTLYLDDFSGANASPLHGTLPDVGGTAWAAYSAFKADGTFGVNQQRGAFLPFTPVAGKLYVLEASMNVQLTNGNTWASLGFAKGVPTNLETTANRLAEGDGVGRAWTLMRTNATVNQEFVGGGTAGSENWVAGPSSGGDFDLRIELNTTGPITGSFYAKRPADAGYTLVSSLNRPLLVSGNPAALADIGAVGFAQNNGVFAAKMTRFSLSEVPEPASVALVGIAALAASGAVRRRSFV